MCLHCRKLPIREIHLNKLLVELGITQKEVRPASLFLYHGEGGGGGGGGGGKGNKGEGEQQPMYMYKLSNYGCS